jgi:hypothetical protein
MAQQEGHLEWGTILVFWWQVEAEGINGHQKTTGHQDMHHIAPGSVSDGHLVGRRGIKVNMGFEGNHKFKNTSLLPECRLFLPSLFIGLISP